MVATAAVSATRRRSLGSADRHRDGLRDVCENEVRFSGNPATIVSALRGADTGMRGQVIGQLQHQLGNGAVQRLLEAEGADGGDGADGRIGAGAAPAVQRWAVGIGRGTTDCMVVVNYMNTNSPYRTTSGWAKTNASFDWSGPLQFDGDDDALTVRVLEPVVTLAKSVDMPTWAPTNPAMRTAWGAMTTDLRAHEALHEAIADRWKATLKQRLAGLSLSITKRSAGQAAVQAEWNSWLTEHQADQTAIDPFTAMLDCSAAVETSSAEEAGADAGVPAGGAEES